jgi:hypothetical protein
MFAPSPLILPSFLGQGHNHGGDYRRIKSELQVKNARPSVPLATMGVQEYHLSQVVFPIVNR